jgi:hypothetical protein
MYHKSVIFCILVYAVDTVEAAEAFYKAVHREMEKKKVTRNKALASLKKDLKTYQKAEAIIQLKNTSQALYDEVSIYRVCIYDLHVHWCTLLLGLCTLMDALFVFQEYQAWDKKNIGQFSDRCKMVLNQRKKK